MEQLEQVFQIDIHRFLVELFLIAIVFLSVDDLYNKLKSRLGIVTKQDLEKEEKYNELKRHSQELNDIRAELVVVREESEKSDADFRDQLKGINDKINVLSRMLVEMQENEDRSKRHELHDRIAQLYRYYHERYINNVPDGIWTQMEKEAFDGLILDYEAHGGKNSFVHTTCQPESALWSIKGE